MRLIDHFDRVADAFPARVFIADGAREVTYGEAQAASRRIASALARDRIRPGARVALFAANGVPSCLAALGLLRAGCVWTTFDVTASPPAMHAALAALDVEAVFHGRAQDQAAAALAALSPALRLICIDGDGARSLESWLGDAPAAFRDVAWRPGDLTTLFSSGGTTGAPKGVMATHRCWVAGLAATLSHNPGEHPVAALLLPITYVAGGSQLLYAAARGGTVVIVGGFDPETLLRTVQERRVTELLLLATGISILLSHPRLRDYDISSLDSLIYGAAPSATPVIVRAMEAFGPILKTGFAQTEMTAACTVLTQEDHVRAVRSGDLARLQSCGRALPQFEVEIMDEDGAILPQGETGEIVIRGEALMTGYYKAPQETQEAMRAGWRLTGDIGWKDADGYVFIVDRKRDMIISRGYKVFPAEVERVLYGHPAVRDCAVVGAPDAVLGETVRAVVSLRPGCTATPRELSAFCRAQLGALKTPVGFEIWDELPLSRIGKVLRHEIRAKYWAGQERKI